MMLKSAKFDDESGRLAALQRYEVLDTPREAAFDRITALVKRILNVPICAISLVDTDRQWFKSCVGLDTDQTSRDISFCAHAIQEPVPLLVSDALKDARFAANPLVTGPPFIRSYLGAPLSTPDGYNIGSLCAIDVVPRMFGPEQIEILKSFAGIVMDDLELRRIAQTDHLTGAATRRGFLRELEKAMARVKRSDRLSALVILDIDHFKSINDTYGHPAGDMVLRSVAEVILNALREGDTLGRLGGDEFGIILESLTVSEALSTSERIRNCLELKPTSKNPFPVSASFGIVEIGPIDPAR